MHRPHGVAKPVRSRLSLLACLVLAACASEFGPDDADLEGDYVLLEAGAADGYVSITPYRLVDTRESTPIGAKAKRCWALGTKIPTGAVAVAVNVTAVAPAAPGFLTAYPFVSGSTKVPGVSTLNYGAGATVANGALVEVGDGNQICVYALTTAHVVVDVTGYVAAAASYTPVAPYRRVDTREVGGIVAAGKSRCWKIAGQNGIPADAKAVALNVTSAASTAEGFLTAYPYSSANSTVPGTSTLNHAAGAAVANGAIVRVGDGGQVCVYAKSASHVILDVSGYLGAATKYKPFTTPTRVLDTRSGGVVYAGGTRCVVLAGKYGIPASASAVAVNIAIVGPNAPGYVLARPAGKAEIGTSTLNFGPGDVRANNAFVELGAFGKVCVYTKASAHLVLDVVGYWPGTHVLDPLTHPVTFAVSNKAQFLNALEKSCSGCKDIVELAPTATVDLTGHTELVIPGSTTIRGGRKSGVAGGLIKTRDTTIMPNYATWNLLRTGGAGVVVRDLRMQGPDGTIGPGTGVMCGALYLRHDDGLVRGTELWAWPSHGVSTSGTRNAIVEHNFIHDNIRTGRGYGVVVGATVTPTVIRYNSFQRNRHSVAGSGTGSYDVHHNRFMNSAPDGIHAVVDMHGENEHKLDNSTHQAGTDLRIHDNDFEFTGTAIATVLIRGIPTVQALVENNCVARTDALTWVSQADMTAYSAPQKGLSCYEKSGVWLCHDPTFGTAMKKIVVRNNRMGTPSGCR